MATAHAAQTISCAIGFVTSQLPMDAFFLLVESLDDGDLRASKGVVIFSFDLLRQLREWRWCEFWWDFWAPAELGL